MNSRFLVVAILMVTVIGLVSAIRPARGPKPNLEGSLCMHDTRDLDDKPKESFQKGENCMLCKVIVQEMFKVVHQNSTEEAIRQALQEVCSLVYPRNNLKRRQCNKVIATYTKEFVELLVDETNPEMICTLLEMCTYERSTETSRNQPTLPRVSLVPTQTASLEPEPIDMNTFISMLDPTIDLGSKKTCYECKLFIEYLRTQVEDPDEQEQVREYLEDNLCKSFQDQRMIDSCNALVEKYAGIIFLAVAHHLDPKEACNEMKACPVKRIIEPKKSAMCDQCIDIVGKIDDFLSHHSVDQDINTIVEQVCNKLGNETLTKECTFVVQMIGKNIADAIATMDSPQQLCTKIYVC